MTAVKVGAAREHQIPGRRWKLLAVRARYQPSRLARLKHCRLWTLQRFFKAKFGLTPKQWLTAVRMEEAQRLAAAGTQTRMIAQILRYKSVTQFCREFRRLHGRTTAAFRRS